MGKKAKRNGVNKSEFIRARPTATIGEVVDAAKKEGISISRDMVHKVRWQVKQHELLHPKPVHIKTPKAKNGAHVKNAPVATGNGFVVEVIEEEWKGLDEAATAMLGASIGAAVKKLVRSEVRAEVRRIMGAGIDS